MADSEAQPNHATDNTNPSKYYNHFLFKAIIVTIFLVLLPLFPSQSPESGLNQPRTWEILQLIFVGIAVSYGLFSKKSDEILLDKENGSSPASSSSSKFDNAQSYVSRLLHVSSVFDDESEDSSVFSDDNNSNSNSNKVFQAWNNQYHRGETESHVHEENLKSISVKTSKVGGKPLLLPVRSLKSRVAEDDLLEETTNNKPDPKRFSSKSMEEKVVENLVLPSPIPWRSRSGRIEIKEESPPLFSSSSKTEDSVFRSQSLRSSSSPSRSPGFSSPRKKTPAPPPPPPHFFGKAPSMKTMSIANKNNNDRSSEKELRRSIRSLPTEIPNEEGQKEATFAGKSRTFTPFNGRGRSYAIEKAKEENQENLGRKERGLGTEEKTEETEDSDMEDEDDFFDENAAMVGTNNHSIVGDDNSGDGGPDVDKKADEFIAKFREQIRLQRIESIRRSAGQAAARNQLVR